MSLPGSEFSGGCLCGAIRFHGALGDQPPGACHCGQCRRWSGHYWVSVTSATIRISGTPAWFRSSAIAERGFCRDCGSALFWRRAGTDVIEVSAGSLDRPTGLRLAGHIYVADKGDYYDITDGLPQAEGAE